VTLCPIAIAVGCVKCPAFKVCPVKTIIGDYRPPADAKNAPKASPKHTGKGRGGKR
jgi:hypothetical protein